MNISKLFWRNLSLGTKLTLLANLLVVVVVIALTTLTMQRERDSFRQELIAQADLLLNTLPLTLRDQLYRQEIDELVEIAKIVGDNETVTRFTIYDKDGVVLMDAATLQPSYSRVADPLGLTILASEESAYRDWQDTQLIAGIPISLGKYKLGAVALGLSTQALDEKLRALTRQSLWLAAIILLVSSGAAFGSARQITHPLKHLARVAAQMAQGDLSTRVTLQSQDEIGRLATDFNLMADVIEKRDTELREFATGLERAVTERTAELVTRNVALRQANAELTLARRQAEAANRTKSTVLSMVSHELRTPLTSILGFAKLIKRRVGRVTGDLNNMQNTARSLEQTHDNIDIIVSEGERLLALINNVLDLAKIESGQGTWKMERVNITAIIKQAVAATNVLFTAKGLAVATAIAPDLPPITGDRDRLIQVLVNFISNAVKFTGTGTITCRAYLGDAASGNAAHLVVSVSDTGIGIAAHDYERVFERFVQIQVGTRPLNQPKGTGLGLPICKEIVEHHGGHIWVESALGEGSTFSFTLPL